MVRLRFIVGGGVMLVLTMALLASVLLLTPSQAPERFLSHNR